MVRIRVAALIVRDRNVLLARHVKHARTTYLLPGGGIGEVLIPSSYRVADVALSIRHDTRRRDRGTGQLEAGS